MEHGEGQQQATSSALVQVDNLRLGQGSQESLHMPQDPS